jgi:hypothetical protein
LLQLGAEIIDGRIGFDESDKILNIFPVRLTDDGMGYGTCTEFITCADHYNLDNEQGINI